MSWSAQREVDLGAAVASGFYALPITMRAYNDRPIIRSVIVKNQSNAAVGVFNQFIAGRPMYTVDANTLSVIPIAPTEQICFAFSLPSGSQQSGRVFLSVTNDVLAASTSALSGSSPGVFILDYTPLDSSTPLE